MTIIGEYWNIRHIFIVVVVFVCFGKLVHNGEIHLGKNEKTKKENQKIKIESLTKK